MNPFEGGHGVRDGGEQRGDRAIARSAEGSSLATAAVIFALLIASWGITYAWGGSKTVGPHLFYAPILLAATRFGHVGALITAIAAGIMCGPLLAFDVEFGLDQTVSNWMIRLISFVVIGQVVAALHLRSLPVVQERLASRHFRQRLESAIAASQIQPVFQPIVDLVTGRIVGVEALARWHSIDGDITMPYAFIPQAEAAGVVTRIDLEILRRAAAQVTVWRATVVEADDFVLAVNMSGKAFDDPRLAERVEAILDAAGLPPAALVAEVTETALIVDLDRAVTRMTELQALGIRLALDDFGVGQSSLAALHRYPIDIIKLDRSFLSLSVNANGRPGLFDAIVQLTNGLSAGMVIAEGIETPAQFRNVVSAGCRHGQGFLFDQAMDSATLERALDAGGYHLPNAGFDPDRAAEA